jgi:plasmid replication initiation protein
MKNKKGGELICRRPESIIEARFSLTKRQNDILDMVFASIEEDNKLQYEIDLARYGQLYNIKDKSNIYRDLKKAVESFEGKGFSITKKINEKKENRIYFSWFSNIQYLDGESKIIVELGQTLKELMLSAKKDCFYQIKYPLNFHNIYSKRLYYYLKSYENSNKNNTGWRIDNLDELRNKLECPKTYERYADFKRFVLKPAYEEINGSSDISFEYEETKIKGKVTTLKFNIKSNSSVSENISSSENETSATIEELPAPEPKKTTKKKENSEEIKQVIKILQEYNITSLEAKKILDASKGDLKLIEQKFNIVRQIKNIDNIVGALIKAIKEDWEAPKRGKNIDNFNNFEQRTYDFKDLEKKLLGWDKD